MSTADNRIETTLPAADLADVLTAFDTVKTKLPFLVDLSPEERKAMLKMGDKNLDFVTKALELATQNQDLLPRAFDVAEMKADVDLLRGLVTVMTRLQPLYDLIEDTYMLVGSEAYAAALDVYRWTRCWMLWARSSPARRPPPNRPLRQSPRRRPSEDRL